jgi:hypothetical protein
MEPGQPLAFHLHFTLTELQWVLDTLILWERALKQGEFHCVFCWGANSSFFSTVRRRKQGYLWPWLWENVLTEAQHKGVQSALTLGKSHFPGGRNIMVWAMKGKFVGVFGTWLCMVGRRGGQTSQKDTPVCAASLFWISSWEVGDFPSGSLGVGTDQLKCAWHWRGAGRN